MLWVSSNEQNACLIETDRGVLGFLDEKPSVSSSVPICKDETLGILETLDMQKHGKTFQGVQEVQVSQESHLGKIETLDRGGTGQSK